MIRQLVKLSVKKNSENSSTPILIGVCEDYAKKILTTHPLKLVQLLEAAWEGGKNNKIGISALFGEYLSYLNLACSSCNADYFTEFNKSELFPVEKSIAWDHLIYAFCIENTGIYEIFRRVLYEFLHGEKLDIPSPEGQMWLRNTEELFYRDTSPFTIFNLVSNIRPDSRASRRNAYYRMFGIDLNFGLDDSRPYPYEKPKAANRDFIPTLEELLREVWRGMINVKNHSGENITDDAAILTLCRKLRDMLTTRRLNGNLAREEFWYVTMMSWFHLTIEFNSPIVDDLKGSASSPEERLRKIGERVGLPPHGRTLNFIELASALSSFLTSIEASFFDDLDKIKMLYDDVNPPFKDNPICRNIKNIITHYSIATGRDIKAKGVTMTNKTR